MDCANPSIDFSGAIIIASDKACDAIGVVPDKRIKILGCAVEQAGQDRLESIPEIIPYTHLTRAFNSACTEASVDFRKSFLDRKAQLEVYTCYPVVPLSFLLSTAMVDNKSSLYSFLDKYPVTITGGLNLAKAPWNNTTLSAIIDMIDFLRSQQTVKLAGIHSVCALGYLQGFLILSR